MILQNEPNEPEPRRFSSGGDTISPPTSVGILSGNARSANTLRADRGKSINFYAAKIACH
jgi:hypothetical protein